MKSTSVRTVALLFTKLPTIPKSEESAFSHDQEDFETIYIAQHDREELYNDILAIDKDKQEQRHPD